MAAGRALVAVAPNAAALLERELADKMEQRRLRATRLLADLEGPRAVELLMRALADERPSVRIAALNALAGLKERAGPAPESMRAAPGGSPAWSKERLTKHEVYSTMRDGVRLFTSFYVPKDTTQTYPIVLRRTPYNSEPGGESQFNATLGRNATNNMTP